MSVNEKSMLFLEEHIPDLADLAVKQAYWKALASGSCVLMCENGNIVEVHPDGSQKVIKKLSPPIRVTKGQRLKING